MAFPLWIEWSHVRKLYKKHVEETKNKWKNLDRNVALLDFSAMIRDGITVVLGPEGSGKSSLLKLTATMILPDDGRISYQMREGKVLSWSQNSLSSSEKEDFEQLRAKIGYVPPLKRMNHHIACEEALYYFAQSRRVTNLRKRCATFLAKWGLAGYRKYPLKDLPLHVLKRYLIAQSLIVNPQFWILDEPTAGLDDIGRNLLMDELQKQAKERIVLLATNDMELAELANHIILLEFGSCRRIGNKKLLTASVSEGTVAAWYQTMQIFAHLHKPVI